MDCVKSFFVVVDNLIDSSGTAAATTTTTEQNAIFTAVLKQDYIHLVIADLKDSAQVWVGKLHGKSNFNTKSTINIDDKDILNALWKYLNSEAFKSISDTDDDHSKNQKLSMCQVTREQQKENDKWDNNLQLCANYHLTKDIVLPISCTLFLIAQREENNGVLLQMFSKYTRLLVQDVAAVTAQKDQLKIALNDCKQTLSLQQDAIDNREHKMLQNFVKVLNSKKEKMRKLKEALKANVDTKAGVTIDKPSTNADIATTAEKKKRRRRQYGGKDDTNPLGRKVKQAKYKAPTFREKIESGTDSSDQDLEMDDYSASKNHGFVFDDDNDDTQLLELESQPILKTQTLDVKAMPSRGIDVKTETNTKLSQLTSDTLDGMW